MKEEQRLLSVDFASYDKSKEGTHNMLADLLTRQ
jgi:hypothetical protein